MAHEVETMAYAGEVPWHGLGVEVSNDLTPLQMMQKAGLDWRVEKVDAYVDINGEQVRTGQQALVRTSDCTILTNVCLLYTSPSPRDKRQSRMPSSA